MGLPLVLLLAVMGLARMIRLVVNDTLLDRPRLWWSMRLPDFWVYLLGCPYCISAWLSLPVAVTVATIYKSWGLVFAWPALWYGSILGYFVLERLAAPTTSQSDPRN